MSSIPSGSRYTWGKQNASPSVSKEFHMEDILAKMKNKYHQQFSKFCFNGADYILVEHLERYLRELGLDPNRPDIKEKIIKVSEGSSKIDFTQFTKLMTSNERRNILQRALQQEVSIPNFKEFCQDLEKIYDEVKDGYHSGSIPEEYPELKVVKDEDMLSVSICTVDGQQFSCGDSKYPFSFQSCILPVIYCIACEQNGISNVHELVGREPSGQPYVSFTLNSDKKPHNPLIATGGIATCSLLHDGKEPNVRYRMVYNKISEMVGELGRLRFFTHVYLSLRAHAHRYAALAYFMRSAGVKGLEGDKLSDSLECFLQMCSMAGTTQDLATIAATLANGGRCPLTHKKVISTSTVASCISLMYSCGMNQFSGEWAFLIGLPAKCSVSGCMMIVIPNVCGIAVYSPKLDERGISVRGFEFVKKLTKQFSLSIFDQLVGGVSNKVDPTINNNVGIAQMTE